MANSIVDMMGTVMSNLRNLVDVDTVVGKPISAPNDITIIPVSKVTFGFGTGGSDFSGKDAQSPQNFGGGGGAGMNVMPIAFLVINGENVKLLPVAPPASGTADRLIDAVPAVIEMIQDLISKNTKEE